MIVLALLSFNPVVLILDLIKPQGLENEFQGFGESVSVSEFHVA